MSGCFIERRENMKLPDKTYDILKFISWLWAPLITLVTALVNIWLFDSKNFEGIVGTLVAIDTFMGAIVAKSNFDYHQNLRAESGSESAGQKPQEHETASDAEGE